MRLAVYCIWELRPDMPLGELPADVLAGLLGEWSAADLETSDKWGRLSRLRTHAALV